jgi:CYTH domain-containing protein
MINVELERRWEVEDLDELKSNHYINDDESIIFIQNYLYFDKRKEDRIRRKLGVDKCEYQRTTKIGKGSNRVEIEDNIERDQWVILNNMLAEKEHKLPIIKTHYEFMLDDYKVELSVYDDPIEHPSIVEIEFDNEEEMRNFKAPEYFGKEITDSYSNIDIWKEHNDLVEDKENRLVSTGEYKGNEHPGYTS